VYTWCFYLIVQVRFVKTDEDESGHVVLLLRSRSRIDCARESSSDFYKDCTAKSIAQFVFDDISSQCEIYGRF
jgi:hypothetical protein